MGSGNTDCKKNKVAGSMGYIFTQAINTYLQFSENISPMPWRVVDVIQSMPGDTAVTLRHQKPF